MARVRIGIGSRSTKLILGGFLLLIFGSTNIYFLSSVGCDNETLHLDIQEDKETIAHLRAINQMLENELAKMKENANASNVNETTTTNTKNNMSNKNDVDNPAVTPVSDFVRHDNVAIVSKIHGEHQWSLAEQKSSMMVIAAFPKHSNQYTVMWSQLECFAEKFDQIIISADHKFKDALDSFVSKVKDNLPEVGSKLKAQYHINNRYDAGLWCDALFQENVINENKKKDEFTKQEQVDEKDHSANSTFHSIIVNASSSFDRFVLINDSMMVLEKSNELLESLKVNNNITFVSLNYWGSKNYTDESPAKRNQHYWLESPARAFNLEGLEIFANHVCTLPPINITNVHHQCPHLTAMPGKNARVKRCIVEKTEISLVKQYPLDKVHGLYRGHDHFNKHWSVNYTFWNTTLRNEFSFPFVKVKMFERMIKDGRSQELDQCTQKMA